MLNCRNWNIFMKSESWSVTFVTSEFTMFNFKTTQTIQKFNLNETDCYVIHETQFVYL